MVARNCCMGLHYKQILKKYLFCPVSMAYRKTSDTRKTMALFIGLSLLQMLPSHSVQKAKCEIYTDFFCTSYLLLRIVDPKSKSAISDLVVPYFNSAKGATLKCGEQIQTSMAVILVNFTTMVKEK